TSGRDYWQSESDLASYDATFAQRIGWKWDYVLAELTRRGWVPPLGELLDWGCGSGIAGRAFLDHFGTQSVTGLRVWDRSAAAMAFAARRAREKYPGLAVDTGRGDFPAGLFAHPPPTHKPAPASRGRGHKSAPSEILESQDRRPSATSFPGFNARDQVLGNPLPMGTGEPNSKILLLSHVLPELTPEQTAELMDLTARAQCVLWVEPGTHEVSRRLIAIRERLRERFNIIAPCTHSTTCGMLTPGNERHWCHHFAAPPREIFTDGNWSRFARLTGIDLRDLPLSFLVLDQRSGPSLPAEAGRVIGHPRIYKAHALLLGCDATGVREHKLNQRTLPAEFRALKKSATDGLRIWEWAGDEIVASKPLPEPAP
ncbi:MAG: hypothetical protein IT579_16790, partial [Verrucomicrobia subdivision 3 bacterium]|nr:hypothetical protein [Limisphaerales bacterium]